MKVKKISDKAYKCIFTHDEIREMGYEPDELNGITDKSRDFISSMLDMASREYDEIDKGCAYKIMAKYDEEQISFILEKHEGPVHDYTDHEGKAPSEDRMNRMRKKMDRHTCIAVFHSLRNIIGFCRDIKLSAVEESSIYKDKKEGSYYLYVKSNDTLEMGKMVGHMLEYGSEEEFCTISREYMRESLLPIIRENALIVLRNMDA